MKKILFTILLSTALSVQATNQTEDLIILDSKIYTIAWPESPFVLKDYIKTHDLKLYGDPSTANYNGHHAIWTVRQKKLYLIGFDSQMGSKMTPGVKDLPGAKDGELFADWFSGTLTLDYGCFPHSKGELGKRKKISFKNGVMTTAVQKAAEGDASEEAGK